MNGNYILLYLDGVAIAAVKSNTIKSKCDAIETASPSTGEWKTYIAGRKDWQMTTSYLVVADTGVRDLLKVGTTYTIKVKGRNSADATGVHGTAILSACDITATRGNLVQGSFQFTGNGALE